MSEPTLYRKIEARTVAELPPLPNGSEVESWNGLKATAWVPVERCEHGNIDPHITFINEHGSVTVLKKQCPGAGIGGDDEC